MIVESNDQEDTIILNIYAPDTKTLKYMKQTWTALREKWTVQ